MQASDGGGNGRGGYLRGGLLKGVTRAVRHGDGGAPRGRGHERRAAQAAGHGVQLGAQGPHVQAARHGQLLHGDGLLLGVQLRVGRGRGGDGDGLGADHELLLLLAAAAAAAAAGSGCAASRSEASCLVVEQLHKLLAGVWMEGWVGGLVGLQCSNHDTHTGQGNVVVEMCVCVWQAGSVVLTSVGRNESMLKSILGL